MLAPIIWSAGLVLLLPLVRKRAVRNVLIALAIVLPIAIAKSRVYLGVHYATDVVGGLALGLCWVLCWWDVVSAADRA